MTLFAWIALGLFAGIVARMFLVRATAFRLLDCALIGSLGALVGGALFGLLGANVAFGLAGALAGAVAILAVGVRARRRVTAPEPAGRA